MNRNTITTGKKHQADVATWARRRLVDSKGGEFDAGNTKVPQHGVILADGVGLGKTWEALAASALILVESSKEKWDRSVRQTVRQQPARVLVLCPPGLVSKWTREIRDPKGFSAYLTRWADSRKRRVFVLDTLAEPYEIRRRGDLAGLNPGKMRYSRFELPAGTYVCNWNVLRKRVGSGRSRLAALRSQHWDVLIVDEAHHREAREAIETVYAWSRGIDATLLLTATPFQLEPREVHQLFGAILDHRHGEHRVLSREPVKGFIDQLAEFFEGSDAPGIGLRRKVEQTLRQAVVRSHVRGTGRRYHILNETGSAIEIDAPDQCVEEELQPMMASLVAPSPAFESWYLTRRLELADGDKTCVPTKLREALSTVGQAKMAGSRRGQPPPCSPRVDALVAWAKTQIKTDLLKSAEDGYPRKLLVFTSYVEKAAGELRERLHESMLDAWVAVKSTAKWRQVACSAPDGIMRVVESVERTIAANSSLKGSDAHRLVEELQKLSNASEEGPVKDLFGHATFRKLVLEDLNHHLGALAAVLSGDRDHGWWAHLHREERRGLQATMDALAETPIVATYTGHDDRRDREAVGEAFRSPLAPWIMVASNVGSEGIDLHNFSAHLVHFDIEWNPAKMEQREGRTDRIGRTLKDPVNIYYVLVRGTYDERMFRQLVARQRWHSVLLGRPAARLDRDQDDLTEARILSMEKVRSLALRLAPR